MPLPDNFSPAEHLQDVTLKVQNRLVKEEFSDLGDETWDADITTSRGSLRVACTHLDTDSIDMTLVRLWLFYGCLRKAKDFHPHIYGIPVTSFKELRKYKPQISLFFLEDHNDIEPGYSPITGEISFRLMNQESNSLSMSEVTNYANRIKTQFATASGFIWKKGKEMVSYTDWKKGYQLQLLCRDKAEGRRVIEQVLDIQAHTPDWKNMNKSGNEEPASAYPTIPPTEIILGKPRRLPRRRPIADVRFQYALLDLHELPNPICLVDRSHTFNRPVVEV